MESWLIFGMLFGAVGAGYCLYGKQQRRIVPMLCGVALMVFPYAVENVILLLLIGVALMVAPFYFSDW